MKPIIITIAALALTTSAAIAQPPNSNSGLVTHNGSLMRVIVRPDGVVQIRYVDPRPAMRPFVVPGTLLVEGRWVAPGEFAGVSHSYWCNHAYPYAVQGRIEPVTGGLVLQGPAPIIDPYACVVLGYEWTGNSILHFEPYQPAGVPPPPPPPPLAPPPIVEPEPVPEALPLPFPVPVPAPLPAIVSQYWRPPAICRIGPQLDPHGRQYVGPPPGCL